MAETTKKKGLGLPQTRGSFQIRGKVNGTQKEKFYIELYQSKNFGYNSTKGNK